MRIYSDTTTQFIKTVEGKYFEMDNIFDTRIEPHDLYKREYVNLRYGSNNNVEMSLVLKSINEKKNEERVEDLKEHIKKEKLLLIEKLNHDFILRVKLSAYNRKGLAHRSDLAIPVDVKNLYLARMINEDNTMKYTCGLLVESEDLKLNISANRFMDRRISQPLPDKDKCIRYVEIEEVGLYSTVGERRLQANYKLDNQVDFETYTKNNFIYTDNSPREGLREDIKVNLIKIAEYKNIEGIDLDYQDAIDKLALKVNIIFDDNVIVHDGKTLVKNLQSLWVNESTNQLPDEENTTDSSPSAPGGKSPEEPENQEGKEKEEDKQGNQAEPPVTVPEASQSLPNTETQDGPKAEEESSASPTLPKEPVDGSDTSSDSSDTESLGGTGIGDSSPGTSDNGEEGTEDLSSGIGG